MKKYCCICKTNVDSFSPSDGISASPYIDQFDIIGSDVKNFFCPNCKCFDRERHLFLYFNALNIFEIYQNKTILHIAPERNLLKRLSAITENLIVGDINPGQYEKEYNVMKIDITNIQLPNDSLDLVIANHVLEHVTDYSKALLEIFRVLKTEGHAVLQTPYSNRIYSNFEDKLINSDELRHAWYGRHDHVRIFGLRLLDDIKDVGFNFNLYKHNELLKLIDYEKFGVNQKESLFLAKKCSS